MRSVFFTGLFMLATFPVAGPVRGAPAGSHRLHLRGKQPQAKTYQIPLPPRPDFSALDWLLGEWKGQSAGRGPERQIRLSVVMALDKRFMIFREEASVDATKSNPASSESWMGVLSSGPLNTSFTFEVFSSTGFITRYRVTVEAGEIHFSPEGGDQPPSGWLFRRMIQRLDVGELSETVQVAPPDRPFFDYYTVKLTRLPPGKESSPALSPANK